MDFMKKSKKIFGKKTLGEKWSKKSSRIQIYIKESSFDTLTWDYGFHQIVTKFIIWDCVFSHCIKKSQSKYVIDKYPIILIKFIVFI